MATTPLRLTGLLVKVESSYGTDAEPSTSEDGIRADGELWTRITPRHEYVNARPDVQSGSLIPVAKARPAGRVCDIEIGVEIKGLGSAYSDSAAPEVLPLMLASGLSATVDDTSSSETVTLALPDTGHDSVTCHVYAGGQLIEVVGCRFNMAIQFTTGGVAIATFTGMGLMPTDHTTTVLASITRSTLLPPPVRGSALTVVGEDTWTPAWSAAGLDLGNEVLLVPDGNAADAVGSFQIVRREPRFTLTAQNETVSTYDPQSEVDGALLNTIDMTLGDTQYSRFKIDVDDARLEDEPGQVDYAGGLSGWDLNYHVHDLAMVFD